MENKKYPIGFWNIIPATKLGPEELDDWADFGTTQTQSGIYDPTQSKEKMLKKLDECAARGIQIIFWDRRADYHQVDNGHYEDDARKITADFLGHPAICAVYLGDEPEAADMEKAIRSVQIYRKICPEKQQLLNLLPWYSDRYGGVEARVAISGDYCAYLEDFIRRSGIQILSYDCYFQLEELHGQPTARALETYYRNLRIFQQAARETGAELWYTTLAVGHMMYRCPTEDDFRWEINTAAASGVQALLYWFFCNDRTNANYRVAPMNELGERTETFRWASTENRIFQQLFGPLFTELELEQCFHAQEAYGGFPLLNKDSDPWICGLDSGRYMESHVPMIISRFTRKNDPDHWYYALVNNSQREPASVYFLLRKPAEVFEVRCDEGAIRLLPHGVQNEIQYWFAPGQLWVVALPKTDAEQK